MQGLLDWFASLPAQVQSGWIAGLTAMITTVLTVGITQYFASRNLKKTLAENRETARETIEANRTALDRTLKAEAQKHKADLAERHADRLFDARREVASRCLGAVQIYKAQHDNTEMQTEASEELRGILDQDAGELAVLFSRELSAIASKISTDLLIIGALEFISEVDELLNESEDKSNEDTEPDSSDEERELDPKFFKHRLSGLFEELTEAFSKELGTYEEPPVKKEA